MNKYIVRVDCSWVEEVRANSMEEAVQKTENKYRYGKGRFPREYVEVRSECAEWCEIE